MEQIDTKKCLNKINKDLRKIKKKIIVKQKKWNKKP